MNTSSVLIFIYTNIFPHITTSSKQKGSHKSQLLNLDEVLKISNIYKI